MSKHWLNQLFRFLLELTALFCVGYWGSSQGSGFTQYVLAIFLPVIMAVSWAVFRYPNDPKINPVIPVSGKVRLLLEFFFFLFAILALYDLGHPGRGADFAFIVILHYGISYDRVLILFREQPI